MWFFVIVVVVISHRKADIALIGLAVMGQNLILNMDSHGFVVCAYNRTVDKVNQKLYNSELSRDKIWKK